MGKQIKLVEQVDGRHAVMVDHIGVAFISLETNRLVVSRYWSKVAGLTVEIGERFTGKKEVHNED